MAFYANIPKTSAKPQRFLRADTEKKLFLCSARRGGDESENKSAAFAFNPAWAEAAFDCYTFRHPSRMPWGCFMTMWKPCCVDRFMTSLRKHVTRALCCEALKSRIPGSCLLALERFASWSIKREVHGSIGRKKISTINKNRLIIDHRRTVRGDK